ncbi:MAG TPA: hypothetical protein VI997_03755 [Candidatus Thermoplasmatota archaeon]|nr:hypothetical protein [Candidatus Thermoplasmatota archaeon]
MRASLATLVLVAALVTPFAQAQVPTLCQAPNVSIAPARLDLASGQAAWVNVTVRNNNAGNFPGAGELEIAPPPGFAAEPMSAQFPSLAGGSQAVVAVKVTALDTAPAGTTRQLTAVATIVCGQGQISQESAPTEATSDLVVAPGGETGLDGVLGVLTRPVTVAIGGLALVILVGAVALKGRREGFGLVCPEPRKSLRPGRGTSFPLEVVNRAGATDTATFEVAEIPEGWTAFTALPEVQLGPREARTLWLMVRAPVGAPAGTKAEVRVRAKSKSHPKRASELVLHAEVHESAPEGEGAAAATG